MKPAAGAPTRVARGHNDDAVTELAARIAQHPEFMTYLGDELGAAAELGLGRGQSQGEQQSTFVLQFVSGSVLP
jgi:hypothetical protein